MQGRLRQKKIYTNGDRPDDDDRQFDGDRDRGVRGHVSEHVVGPTAELLLLLLLPPPLKTVVRSSPPAAGTVGGGPEGDVR